MSTSNLTPARGKTVTFRTRLFACTKSERARKALAGTKLRFERKTANGYDVLATKRVDSECRTVFRKEANFDRATFRATWPKQLPAYRRGSSGTATIVTH
jgi:hypothetical protein